MFNLYYIVGYDHRANVWLRFAVTGADRVQALARVEDWEPQLTRLGATLVCQTNDDVYMEL